MLKNKTKMFLLFSLVLITMIGMTAISAADTANDTAVNTVSSDASNQVVDTITSVDASDNSNKHIIGNTQTNDKTIKNDGETGTLSDLQTDIESAENTITLNKDYTSTSEEQPFVIAKDITIDGNGKTITAVNGAFNISSGYTVNIKNLVFTGKMGPSAMIRVEGTLNLENVTFNDCLTNGTSYPAVIDAIANSKFSMDGCSINNTCSTTAPIRIGAYIDATIKNTNITNVISKNAIIYNNGRDSNLTIDGCILANGNGSNYGGAIYYNYQGTLIVNNTIIENNTASYRGGAIYSAANTTLTNCIIRNNTLTSTSYNRPEGVWLHNSNAVLNVANNTFIDNHCGYDEAYYFNNGKMNSTVLITVANISYEEDETPVLVAFVTDADGNKIGDRVGTITFNVEGQTFTASIENGTAAVAAPGLEVDNSFRVTASYNNAPEEAQIVEEGVVDYGNVLPPMTNYTSMQEVIDSQEAQAVIKLNNNITRVDEEEKVILDKDLTINGKGLTIDANQGMVFEVTDGATVTIQNLTIINANSANVINITNGNVVLDNVIIKDTNVTATYAVGALIAVKPGSTLNLTNSVIENITGPLMDVNGTTIINNTTFRNVNGGSANGEIYVRTNLTMIDSTVENCTAYSGFLYSTAGLPAFKLNGELNIDNCTFTDNIVTMGNSIISVSNKTTISNSKFIRNQATRTGTYGSAIGVSGSSADVVTMTITKSLFENNTANGDEGSTVFVGSYATMNITNSIFLRNDTQTFISYGTTQSKAIVNGNYWGSNDDPVESGAVAKETEEYDDWAEEWTTIVHDVTIDNWVIFDVTVTEDPEDNFLFNVEAGFNKVTDEEGTITTVEQTIPDYLPVTFAATAGSFESSEATPVNGVATNVYHAGLEDAELTIATNNVTKTFNITAPEIIPNNYRGLQILLDATADGQTVDLTMNVKRGEQENNVTITNKTLVIDGNGYTINENDGRFLMIQNANVTLKNMIIKNAGTSYNPSVIQVWPGNLVLENVTIIDSTAANQGALVYVGSDSTATINNVTFDNNTARFISTAGTTLINNSVVKNTNASTYSMDFWGYNNGALTVENTVFENNIGYSSGINTGSASSESIVLNNVTFTNNTVSSPGTSGVIINSNGPMNITNSRFENNGANGTSSISGLLYVKGQTFVDNSSFINNRLKSTSSYGAVVGVFYLNAQRNSLNITKSVFINNTGAVRGNVIYNYYGSFNISNSVLIGNTGDNNTVALHNYDSTSYANNNWWGTNDSPRSYVYEQGSSYKILTDTWVIMNATASDVEDGQVTITTTLNQVTDADGTVSDLVGSLPEIDVTYDVTVGTLVDSTKLVDGVSTATVQTADDLYEVTVTQTQESITLSNDVETGDIIVTNDSYSRYFNEDGTANTKIKAGSIVYISGDLSDKNFIFNVPVTVTTYNQTQANLTNARFVFNKQASGSNMTNLIINNTDYTDVAVFVNQATNMNITNNTITQRNNEGTTIGIAFNQTTATTIEANNITVYAKSYAITSTELLSRTAAIQGYNSSANSVLDNDITMVGLGNGGREIDQDTMIGIEVRGEYYIDYNTYAMANDESTNNMISDNRIAVSGDAKYNYGIRFGNNVDETIINNNTINVTGTVYACGVEVGKSDDSQVLYNNITAVAENYTYGVYLTTNNLGQVNTATVYANNINLSAKDNYGVELYGADETTVSENVIIATGDYSMGIAAYNSDENYITDNNITLIGNSNSTKQLTADKITQDIAGIILLAYSDSIGNTVTGNTITVTDLAGNDAYAVTIKGEDNTVTDNTLIGTNLMGDAAVNATEDNTVENNGPIGDLIITNDTYSKYFDDAGVFTVTKQLEGSSVYLSGEFTDKDFIFNIPVNVTTHTTQAVLNNSYIRFNTGAEGSNISNIIINNKDYSEYVIYLDDVDDITVDNMTITQENTQLNSTHAIGINYGNDITIKNSNINTIGKCIDVVYDNNYRGTTQTSSILAIGTDGLVIDSNTITTNQTGTASTYGTLQSLDIKGVLGDEDKDIEDDLVEGLKVTNNVINTESTVYTYGLVLNYLVKGALVDNNTFNSYSQYYSNGIEAFNTSETNITNNKINANSAEFAYGIYLSGMFDWNTYDIYNTDYNNVLYNTIICNSSVAYVIELYMSPNNIISYNNFTANSNYSIGIAGSDSGYNTITYNNMNLNNDMLQSTVPSYDSINSYPTGVKFVYGYMAQPGYNTVQYNNITIKSQNDDVLYAVNLTDTEDNTITDNILYGVHTRGQNSVYYEEDNTVENNLPDSVIVTMDDVHGVVGQSATLTATITDNLGNVINEGSVIFMDEEGNVLATVDVVDGTASYVLQSNKAVNMTITAVYEGEEATATVEFGKAYTTITINEFNATVDQETTISATVLDENGNAVNGGKVAFKVNGKTLKDENGKVIYAQVVDGIATISIIVPDTWAGKDIEISAVYSGSTKYDSSRSEAVAVNVTMVVDEEIVDINPAIKIDALPDEVATGTTLQVTVEVTGTPSPLNTGKMVLKLNGKTLKDDNGKVIYADVVDGKATFNVTFTTTKTKDFTVKAVFIHQDYESLEDNATITVKK
jgi:hypothetical protein